MRRHRCRELHHSTPDPAGRAGKPSRLATWVLGEASRQAAIWRRCGHAIGVAVNVSARQLDDDSLIEDVRRTLDDSGLDPGALTLEVTETTLMRDTDATARRLVQLKQLGVLIERDDFGTGYSSLAYLRQFPADILKIDRSFVSGITTSDESAALIHTLVHSDGRLIVESAHQRSSIIQDFPVTYDAHSNLARTSLDG
jgi:EAL domain-containing protein (putative c-di-GMP-specific phosphodiesterase class I)